MIAVLTGKVITSNPPDKGDWVPVLAGYFARFGTSPGDWEIFPGKEFRLKLKDPGKALETVFYIKSLIRFFEGFDIRLGIGLAENRRAVTSSIEFDQALKNAAHAFRQTKRKNASLWIKSRQKAFDREINLMLQLALTFMNSWSQTSAAMVQYTLENPGKSQQEMARQLQVSQSTVSQRLSRANYRLLRKLTAYFATKLKTEF